MYNGMKAEFGIAMQNSFGTAPDVGSVMYLPILGESLDIELPPLYPDDFDGVLEQAKNVEQGPMTIGGDLSINVGPITLGQVLKAAINDPTSTLTGSCYSHVFIPRSGDFDIYAAQRPCATVKTWDGVNSAEMFYDLNVSQLELSCAQGELLKAKAVFVGGKRTYIAPVTPSYPAGRRVPWDVASIQVGSSTGMAAHPNWRNLTITLDNAIEAKHLLNGSQSPARIERTGFRTIKVAGTMLFDNLLDYDVFIAQTERAFIATFHGKETVMTNTRNILQVNIPALRYTEFKRPTAGPGRIEVNFAADAVYHAGSGHAFKFTLANTYVAY